MMEKKFVVWFVAVAMFITTPFLAGCGGYSHSIGDEDRHITMDAHGAEHHGHTRAEAVRSPGDDEMDDEGGDDVGRDVVGAGVDASFADRRPFRTGAKENPGSLGSGNVLIGDRFSFGSVQVVHSVDVSKSGVLDQQPPSGYARITGGMQGWVQNFSTAPVGGGGVVAGDGFRYGAIRQIEKIDADEDATLHIKRPRLLAIAPNLSTMWAGEKKGKNASSVSRPRRRKGVTAFGSRFSWGSIRQIEKIEVDKDGVLDREPPGFTIEGL